MKRNRVNKKPEGGIFASETKKGGQMAAFTLCFFMVLK
jgi:hypothetical protein